MGDPAEEERGRSDRARRPHAPHVALTAGGQVGVGGPPVQPPAEEEPGAAHEKWQLVHKGAARTAGVTDLRGKCARRAPALHEN